MAKLKFFYSTMGAGKSLDLLRINDNYTRLNKSCLLLKPSIDTRWKVDKIVSRIGVEESCHTFNETQNLYDFIIDHAAADHSCILLDEAQFLTKQQVWELGNIVDFIELPVICFGLRTDYNGNPFNGSKALLAIADEIKEIIMLCHCGRKATMTARFDKATRKMIKDGVDGEGVIRVGDADYTAVCRKHWVNENLGFK